MRQFKIFNDFKKEESYLEEMAKQGYIFKKCSTFGFLISYIFTIMDCYVYNGANFSFSDIHLWVWIPIILFMILAFFYGMRTINAHKKYKNKIQKQRILRFFRRNTMQVKNTILFK